MRQLLQPVILAPVVQRGGADESRPYVGGGGLYEAHTLGGYGGVGDGGYDGGHGDARVCWIKE